MKGVSILLTAKIRQNTCPNFSVNIYQKSCPTNLQQ